MEIKEEVLDELIEFMEDFPKITGQIIQIGEYKGYNVRVELVKEEEEKK